MLKPVRLILVAGFLGSGKTSLILAAAQMLRARGLRAGVIANDQAGELVDACLFESSGFDAEEVAGGCFCCKLSDFLSAADRLWKAEVDCILAEPVGSCTDLAATILEPLRRDHADRFSVAPITVLIDRHRATSICDPDGDPLIRYLFEQQIAEADIAAISKSDLSEPLDNAIVGRDSISLSAMTGDGVPAWLDRVLQDSPRTGWRLPHLDYARYAAAEAALGWLNWSAHIDLVEPRSPAALVGPLLDDLDDRLTRSGAAIMHLKIFDSAASGFIKAALCQNRQEALQDPHVEGNLDASPQDLHRLIINLRAVADPDLLSQIVAECIARIPGRISNLITSSFRPSPPVPEQRITS